MQSYGGWSSSFGSGLIGGATYVIELVRWGISNNGTNAIATTQGINNALAYANQNGYTYVKLPSGTYLIGKGVKGSGLAGATSGIDLSTSACIQPQSNMTIDLYGCTIQKEVNGWISYNTILIKDKQNITLLGGKVVGDHMAHDYTEAGIHEGCIGICVSGSKNILFDSMDVSGFPGYNINLSGEGSQLIHTVPADWETGTYDKNTGAIVTNSNMMRLNKYMQLSMMATISGSGIPYNTSTNGGYFVIWGNGYGSYGTRYDGGPVNLSKSVFEIFCYDAGGVFKGTMLKRPTDAIYLDTLPAGTTQFKLSVRYDITQIIPSTLNLDIQAVKYSRVITIRNCDIHDSFALAIAVTGAQQILIENCEMYNIGNSVAKIGRALYFFPMAIDIEDGANINQHIIIRNNIFRDNEALHISVSQTRNILLENNKFDTPTNKNSGGVVFQGSRGANLVSRGNYYNCSIGFGQGNVLFQNDTFVEAEVQIQFEVTYDRCLFENVSIQLDLSTYPTWTAIAYDVHDGGGVLPTNKTGAWLTNPLYYVCIVGGAQNWGAQKYTVNNTVISNNKVYKCTVAPTTNSANQPNGTTTTAYADGYTWQYITDNSEPIWKTDGTDTTDNAGNVWRSNAYYPDGRGYELVKFNNCKISCTKIESLSNTVWITRRGSVEFDNCRFNLLKTNGYFTDSSSGSDYLGRNSFKFKYCEFDSPLMGGIKGDKVSFTNSVFTGKAGDVSWTEHNANELIMSDCVFNNYDIKLRGIPNTLTKTIYFTNNRINLSKTVRTFGLNNEGAFISNFENVFIENNKAFMTNPSVIARALTVYAEKYLKIRGNYFESAMNNSEQGLELFGAFRNGTYTNPIPSLTTYIENNHIIKYPFIISQSYASQLRKTMGDGLTDINSSSVGTTDRVSTIPTSGVYVLGQILYNSAPATSSYIGWVCTTGGVANATLWTTGATTYVVNTIVNNGTNVYICTVKGAGTSTNQPTGTLSTEVAYADGYSWLYLGTLAAFKPFGLIS